MNGFFNVLRLIRAQNLMIVAFTQVMVRLYLTEGENAATKLLDFRLWLIVLATILIAAAGYIINDYYDVKIDAVNRPEKVLLGRELRRRPLMLFHFFLNLIGIALTLPLKSWVLTSLFFFSANLLWFYSNRLKRLPLIGNISIAALSSLTVALPGIYFTANVFLLIMYVLLAFFISLIREVIKDVEDIRGDKQFGCKTFPIVFGMRRTKIFLFIILIIFLFIIVFSWLNVMERGWYLIAVVIPFSFALGYMLFRADRKKDYKQLSLLCKIYMLLGVLSMSLI